MHSQLRPKSDQKGVPTFFPPKIPAKLFLSEGRSGKRSNSSKTLSEKGSLLPIEELFTGKTSSLLVPWSRILTGKASFSFQDALASLKMRFLAGILGGKNVGTPYVPIN